MKIFFTERAMSDYVDLSLKLQALVKKQFDLLLQNFRYPSLRVKKYDESQDIWQGRISSDYRFYFKIDGEIYTIITIKKHPK